jgi:N-acetylneuraminic acid mutarotase
LETVTGKRNAQLAPSDVVVAELHALVLEHLERGGANADLVRWLAEELHTLKRPHCSRLCQVYRLAKEGGTSRREEASAAADDGAGRDAWTQLPPMDSCRSGLAVSVLDDSIYAIGGSDGASRLSSCEVLHVGAHTSHAVWAPVPPMKSGRSGFSTATMDGKLYVVGGFDGSECLAGTEVFSPMTQAWGQCPKMSVCRSWLATTVLDNKLYAVGGSDGQHALMSGEAFDPASGSWQILPPMAVCRSRFAMLDLGGKVFAVGGFDGTQCLASVEVFTDEGFWPQRKEAWEKLPPMASARCWLAVCVLHEKLFAVGGSNGAQALASAEMFDPASGAWEQLPPMLSHRSGLTTVVMNSKLYVLGGYDGCQCLASAEVFDPDAGTWMSLPSGGVRRSGFNAVGFRGKIYAIGGFDGANCLESAEVLDTAVVATGICGDRAALPSLCGESGGSSGEHCAANVKLVHQVRHLLTAVQSLSSRQLAVLLLGDSAAGWQHRRATMLLQLVFQCWEGQVAEAKPPQLKLQWDEAGRRQILLDKVATTIAVLWKQVGLQPILLIAMASWRRVVMCQLNDGSLDEEKSEGELFSGRAQSELPQVTDGLALPDASAEPDAEPQAINPGAALPKGSAGAALSDEASQTTRMMAGTLLPGAVAEPSTVIAGPALPDAAAEPPEVMAGAALPDATDKQRASMTRAAQLLWRLGGLQVLLVTIKIWREIMIGERYGRIVDKQRQEVEQAGSGVLAAASDKLATVKTTAAELLMSTSVFQSLMITMATWREFVALATLGDLDEQHTSDKQREIKARAAQLVSLKTTAAELL